MSEAKTASAKRIMGGGFFWNAVYAGLNAIQSAVILFAVSRTHDLSMAGILTIGFTISNLAAIIARYGIRSYQVTDIHETYRFPDYFLSRIISTTGTAVLSLGYLLYMLVSGRYAANKTLIILEIVILKLIGALEEVFVSRLQQKGRLDIGARIAALRLGIATLIIFSALWVIPSLPLCLLIGIVAEILLDILLIPGGSKYADLRVAPMNSRAAWKLLKIGIPLCVGMALHNYVANAPKYLVDMYLNDDLQAVCGYVMMPMFVLTMLNTFVMQPAVKGLGDAWHTDRAFFQKKVVRHIMLIYALAIVVLGAGLVLGLPILSRMYKVDLLSYREEFLILMAGGLLSTISSYLIVLLATMRRQRGVVWGCAAAAAVHLALGGLMTRRAGFTGACWLYIIANAAMILVFLLFLLQKGENRVECFKISGEDAAADS